MLTTTTFELPGQRVVRCIGVVRGITIFRKVQGKWLLARDANLLVKV
jgi:uncharacterized protein YbjQ (UPF0145 family)